METRAPLFKRKYKGISPILATIILIVITVVVGAMLYGFVTGFFSSTATSMNANVETSLVIPSGATSATWTLTVKNAGSVAITSMTVSLYAPNGTAIVSGYTPANMPKLAPGQEYTVTLSGSQNNLDAQNIVAGSSYSYQVILTFANGAQKTITGSITASSF